MRDPRRTIDLVVQVALQAPGCHEYILGERAEPGAVNDDDEVDRDLRDEPCALDGERIGARGEGG